MKSRIKALIGAEDADAILSDDQLVDMLKAEGFDIARRTVAKYREAIGIGSLGPAAPAEGDRAGGLIASFPTRVRMGMMARWMPPRFTVV